MISSTTTCYSSLSVTQRTHLVMHGKDMLMSKLLRLVDFAYWHWWQLPPKFWKTNEKSVRAMVFLHNVVSRFYSYKSVSRAYSKLQSLQNFI